MITKIESFIFKNSISINRTLVIKLITVFALVNILTVLPDVFHIFSDQGIIKSQVNQRYAFWYQPVLNWFFKSFSYFGLNANATLLVFIFIYISSLIAILLNFKRTGFAFVAWFIHFTLINSAYLFSYGADYFMSFTLFINLAVCSSLLFKKDIQSSLYSFIIRFLQIHLCLVYFFAGLGKALGTDWIDGNAIWFVINTYTSDSVIENSLPLIAYPMFFKILGWGTVALELLYPILMFTKFSRKVTLWLVVLLHIGIAVFMEFYTFGSIMILLNFIAFGQHLKLKFIEKINIKIKTKSLETRGV
ncbi:hypothetical protein [uncultured Tenacibaculum sp.]|uniref:hypothetical protein n=1 Tax=uncultured Tenacibaculum sp. TaxID=174713 RepID=UPI00260DA8B9|nr:hypothetical protein [uncultured Tenacibaculum sp.]